MTKLSRMGREEIRRWLSENSEAIVAARAAFEACALAYGVLLAEKDGAFERDGTDAKRFAADVMDRADSMLAEEIRHDRGL